MPRARPSPEFETRVLELCLAGWTRERIAEHLGSTPDTVKHVLARARRAGTERICTRPGCGQRHNRDHSWCLDCQRISQAQRRAGTYVGQGRPVDRDCSVPPAPPPGFTKRDLHAGKPYDSSYTRDDDWLDGDRPGHFEAGHRAM